MAPDPWCREGQPARVCRERHYAPYLTRAPTGSDYLCPVPEHADRHASLSINPGDRGMWMVWCCHGGCEPGIVRDALVHLGVDPKCLGRYGLPKRAPAPGMPARAGADSTIFAAAKRSYAMAKLAGSDLGNASLLKMCLQAISEGDGDLPGDPVRLLPADFSEFVALARRTGIERRYSYQLFRKRIALP